MFFVLSLFFLVSNINIVLAEDPIPTPSVDEVNAIAKNMYCPVCENIPLDVCGTPACIQWRSQIDEKLSLGWDDQQIYDYFVSLYGDRVLAKPPKKGLNWLIYIMPPSVILVGIVLFYRKGKTWQQPISTITGKENIINESKKSEYQSQIEKDISKYD